MKKLPKIITIIGPTASGKTKLAVALARRFNGEIVSADSRQVYRGMDLGTGKDLAEYGTGNNRVPYHLIDVANPEDQFDLKRYQTAAYKAINGLIKRKKLPILVGGSGLYIQAVVDGYQLSEASAKSASLEGNLSLTQIESKLGKAFMDRLNDSDRKNRRRLLRYLEIMEQSEMAHQQLHAASQPKYDTLVIGLSASIETIRKNIKKRLTSRFKEGMIDEVQCLHEEGLSWERLESFGLEYKFIARYLQKKLPLAEMKEKLAIASGQFAKRQLTWFRRWEKQGRVITWIRAKQVSKAEGLIKNFLN